jgi:hypothetical protein
MVCMSRRAAPKATGWRLASPAQVIPPAGWRARRTTFPDLKQVKINTPIRQHVFGSKGAYRCRGGREGGFRAEGRAAQARRHGLEGTEKVQKVQKGHW